MSTLAPLHSEHCRLQLNRFSVMFENNMEESEEFTRELQKVRSFVCGGMVSIDQRRNQRLIDLNGVRAYEWRPISANNQMVGGFKRIYLLYVIAPRDLVAMIKLQDETPQNFIVI